MTVTLNELHCHLTGQEERPIYSQFKVISNNDVPRISEQTSTQVGRFKKDDNQTKFKWIFDDENDAGPEVNYDIAMETLKNSSVQVLFKVDRNYHEQQTEIVLKKIKASQISSSKNKESNRGKTTYVSASNKLNLQRDGSQKIGRMEARSYLNIREDMSINSVNPPLGETESSQNIQTSEAKDNAEDIHLAVSEIPNQIENLLKQAQPSRMYVTDGEFS